MIAEVFEDGQRGGTQDQFQIRNTKDSENAHLLCHLHQRRDHLHHHPLMHHHLRQCSCRLREVSCRLCARLRLLRRIFKFLPLPTLVLIGTVKKRPEKKRVSKEGSKRSQRSVAATLGQCGVDRWKIYMYFVVPGG